jgi:hypothetical protein
MVEFALRANGFSIRWSCFLMCVQLFVRPGQRNQSPSPQESAEVFGFERLERVATGVTGWGDLAWPCAGGGRQVWECVCRSDRG